MCPAKRVALAHLNFVMSSVEEGQEASIDYFLFRQCPAEFKLKATESSGSNSTLKAEEIPAWTSAVSPKDSLLHISHEKGVIVFPHYKSGKTLQTHIFDI